MPAEQNGAASSSITFTCVRSNLSKRSNAANHHVLFFHVRFPSDEALFHCPSGVDSPDNQYLLLFSEPLIVLVPCVQA